MMDWLCGFSIILVFHWNFYLAETLSSKCLQPVDARKRPIPFNHSAEATSSIRLPSGTMGIITSYKFRCCGTISSWKTYIYPQGNEHYDGQYNVDFQVWRPAKTVLDDGCYSMIGYSRYSGVLGLNGLVSKVVNEPRRIKFQAGDVVGIFVFRIYNATDAGRRSGLMLDTSYGEEIVWYHVNVPNDPLVIGASSCPLPVGPKRKLSNFINAAPLLSVQVAKFPCSAYKGFSAQKTKPANISMQRRRSSEQAGKNGGWTNIIVAIAVVITIMILIALLVLMAIGALENRKGKIGLRFPGPWNLKKGGKSPTGSKSKSSLKLPNLDPIPRQDKEQELNSCLLRSPPPDYVYSDTTEDGTPQNNPFYLSSSPPPEAPKTQKQKKDQHLNLTDNSSQYLSPREGSRSSQETYYSPDEDDRVLYSSTQTIRSSKKDGHKDQPTKGHSHRPKDGPKDAHQDGRPKDGHSHRPEHGHQTGHSHRPPQDGHSHSHRPKDGHSHRPRVAHHSHRPQDERPQDGQPKDTKDAHQDGHSHRPKDAHQDGRPHRPQDDRLKDPKDAHQDGRPHRPKDAHQDGRPHRPKDAPQMQGSDSHRRIYSHHPKDDQQSSRHREGHSHRSKDGHHSPHRSHKSDDAKQGNPPGAAVGHTAAGPPHSRHTNRTEHRPKRSNSGNHLVPQHRNHKKTTAKNDPGKKPHQESSSSTGTPNPFPEIPTQVLENLPAPLTPEAQTSTPQPPKKPFILMTPELLKMAGNSSELSSMPVHVPGSTMDYAQLFTSARSQAIFNSRNKK